MADSRSEVLSREIARAPQRLHEYEAGCAYAMPATIEDALSVSIPPELISLWLIHCETNPPLFPIKDFVWDIRRLVDGDYEFALECLLPVLSEWSDPEQLSAMWAEAAARPYRDGRDMLVLRALASLNHDYESDGLSRLLGKNGDWSSVEAKAISRLMVLFSALNSAEIDRLSILVRHPDHVTQIERNAERSTRLHMASKAGWLPLGSDVTRAEATAWGFLFIGIRADFLDDWEVALDHFERKFFSWRCGEILAGRNAPDLVPATDERDRPQLGPRLGPTLIGRKKGRR